MMLSPLHVARRMPGWLLVFLVASGCQPAPQDAPAPGAPADAWDPAAEEAAVRAVLNEQVVAWNEGDVEAFMDGYLHSDSLRFASGGTVRRGWDSTLARYRRSYPDRAAMGTLAFDELDVRLLAPQWAVVFGRWHLSRAEDQGDLGGLFTLLFEKRPEGWRIVHDHTSSAS